MAPAQGWHAQIEKCIKFFGEWCLARALKAHMLKSKLKTRRGRQNATRKGKGNQGRHKEGKQENNNKKQRTWPTTMRTWRHCVAEASKKKHSGKGKETSKDSEDNCKHKKGQEESNNKRPHENEKMQGTKVKTLCGWGHPQKSNKGRERKSKKQRKETRRHKEGKKKAKTKSNEKKNIQGRKWRHYVAEGSKKKK